MGSNKDESAGYAIFGISWGLGLSIIFISLILATSGFRTSIFSILVLYPIAISIISIMVGIYGVRKKKFEKVRTKSRLAAMLMAWAPGMGHDYLGRPKEGIKFLIPLIVGIFITFLSVPLQDGDLVFYGGAFMIFSVTWSCVDVNRICDEMDLPYSESPFGSQIEIHFKRSDLLEVLLFFGMWLLLLIIGHVILTDMMTEPLPDKDYIFFFDCIALLFPLSISVKYLWSHASKSKVRE
jgi:hypothetical protein